MKKKQIDYISNIKPKSKMIEDIHIVMCCWQRINLLEIQLDNLNEQTVSNRIHIHLLNNNVENREKLDEMIIDFRIKYTNIKISLSHYNNEYYGFQRFLYVKDNLIKNYNIDYVLFIDDDQIFDNDWVENIYNSREPKTYKAWYCKYWTNDNIDYWTGSPLSISYCKRWDVNKDIDTIHYCATCGCIIDTTIFYENSVLWNIPTDIPRDVSVYNIEDLYLSFIAKKVYGWKLVLSKFTEKQNFNSTNLECKKVALYLTLKEQKQILLEYLVKKYGL
jgi:hypothetical protein